jgi:tryptophan-rich sensory protein
MFVSIVIIVLTLLTLCIKFIFEPTNVHGSVLLIPQSKEFRQHTARAKG